MRDAYHEELDALTTSLVEFTHRVSSALGRATQALLDADRELAEQVITGDIALDAFAADVEARAIDLLARQQPVATDLRAIVSALRMVVDLERDGDLALHIAQLARRRYPASAVPAELRATILQMSQVAERIIAKAGSVLAARDVALAMELERDDDEMDELNRALFRVLLSPNWTGGVESAVDIVLAGRFYERFADHAVSIARRVVFLVTGERAPRPVAT